MEKKLIAFTFDDVPSYAECDGNPTTTIIETLSSFGGKATFFVVGEHIKQNGRKLIEAALEKGFELGNHTYSHKSLCDMSEEETVKEIDSLQKLVKEEFGIEMKYIRPGFLSTNEHLFKYAEENKMPVIFGSKSDGCLFDWDPATTPSFVKETCLKTAYPGQIVLMHGYSKGTAGCFAELCKELSDSGYEFVTLTELFEAYGITDFPYGRPIPDAELSEI